MNPCATSFSPSPPTYAETLKKSLPPGHRRRESHSTAAADKNTEQHARLDQLARESSVDSSAPVSIARGTMSNDSPSTTATSVSVPRRADEKESSPKSGRQRSQKPEAEATNQNGNPLAGTTTQQQLPWPFYGFPFAVPNPNLFLNAYSSSPDTASMPGPGLHPGIPMTLGFVSPALLSQQLGVSIFCPPQPMLPQTCYSYGGYFPQVESQGHPMSQGPVAEYPPWYQANFQTDHGKIQERVPEDTSSKDIKSSGSQDFKLGATSARDQGASKGRTAEKSQTGKSADDRSRKIGEDECESRNSEGRRPFTPNIGRRLEPSSLGIPKRPRNAPPPNAPRGPASLRGKAGTNIKAKSQQQLTPNTPDTGTWSQSKRWVSQETKERTAHQKLMQNLHYMGANKSPFIPQTPAALTAFRIEEAEFQSRRLRKRVDDMSKRRGSSDDEDMRPRLLDGNALKDDLSPFFAQESCFNDRDTSDDRFRIKWPSLAELKEEGDKRATRYGRYFPLPRLNVVADPILQRERQGAYNPDGSIRWEKKAIKPESRFIRPVTSETEPIGLSAQCELKLHELSESLQALLRELALEDAVAENGVDEEC